MIANQNLLSRRAAAEYLGVSIGTITNWIREGRLPSFRLVGRIKIRIQDLDGLLQKEQTPLEKHKRSNATLDRVAHEDAVRFLNTFLHPNQ